MNRILCAYVAACALFVSLANVQADVGKTVNRPHSECNYLPDGVTATHQIPADIGPVTINLSGNRSSVLDLYVYDQWGNFLASAQGDGDQKYVTIHVPYRQTLQIVVVNRGYENYYCIHVH